MLRRTSIILVLCLIFSQLIIPNTLALGNNRAVTQPGYDNIGAVLTSMGSGYSFTTITDAQLASSSFNLNDYNQIFINCAGTNYMYAASAKNRLRNWVNEGGSLYVSDFAYIFIEEAFPGYINFPANPYIGSEQTISASVVNAGLAWYLNPAAPLASLDLTFDLGGWVPINSIASGTTEYLRGTFATSAGTMTNKPLTASFKYGKGRVIFTSFHNEAQLSETEQKLLKYLILIPSAASTSSELLSWLQSYSPGLILLAENINTINQGETSSAFSYSAAAGQDLVFGLNWAGSALKMSVYKPNGTLYRSVESSNSPFKINANNASAGNWTYTVTGTSVPTANYPYVAIVAKNGALASRLSLSAKKRSVRKGQTATLSGQLKDFATGKALTNKKVKLLKKVVKKKKSSGKLVATVSWKLVAVAKTNSKGRFSFKPRINNTIIFKAQFPGNSRNAAKNSKTVTVKAK